MQLNQLLQPKYLIIAIPASPKNALQNIYFSVSVSYKQTP